ncbi:MAG: V-type ATP synthase subunit I [Tissierellaceae bacterium]|nr:V-type ATP synthase subunit I [Tissierellaceae bacterium]
MAIVKMSNFSLFAFDSERDKLLHQLQKFGYVHFTSLDDNEELIEEGLEAVAIPKSIGEVDEEISKVKYAIDLLTKYYKKETGIKAMIKGMDNFNFDQLEDKASNIDYLPVYHELRELSAELDHINSQMKDLGSQKDELRHWKGLEYPIDELKGFQKTKIFMGTSPKKMKEKFDKDLLNLNLTHVENISEDKDNIYLFAMTASEEAEELNEILRNCGFSNIVLSGEKTPKEEIEFIDERLKELDHSSQEVKSSIDKLSENLPDFQLVYEYLMNKKLRLMVSEDFLTTEKVNVINGYIPSDLREEFEKAVKESLKDAYYLNIEDAKDDDPAVPVLLKNSRFAETFESLTTMYALPRYNEIDPTPLLAPFYLAFFGMMVGDAGYGILMLIGTLLVLKVANLPSTQEKFIRFFYYLSYSVIVWGVVFGSYFGGAIPIRGLMDPATQYQELLIISIVFGLIHLFFGLGISAYLSIREKRYLDALFDVGFWYMAVAGGIVFLLTALMPLGPMINTISKYVMIAGMVGIVLTGGRESEGVATKTVSGLFSLYGISSYVGDFVSYSRLMALGLAGGFISASINMMVGMLFNIGFIGIILGVVVFLGGQLFNLFLSLLGAYVHTSRLTYVEFFSKFYEGGGEFFKIFRNKAKYINLK